MAYTGRTPAAAPLTSGDIPDGSVTPDDLSTGAPSWDTNGKVTTGDGLTVGRGAGNVSTNTAVGASALDANTTGSENTAVGSGTLVSNQTGVSNTAVGRSALSGNTASNNTAVGRYSMLFNTTGADNSAIGSASLYQNTTGNYNTALGRSALYSNTTASNNTAVGYQAVYSNQTGAYLVGVGNYALKSATAGANDALGYAAMYSTTTGINNVGIGFSSLYNNTSGASNTALGNQALLSNTTASDNTAVGFEAAKVVTTGGGNTIIGRRAAHQLTTGTVNAFLGYNSGNAITTGSKNTIIGSFTGNAGGLDIRTSSNQIVLSDGDGNPYIWYNPVEGIKVRSVGTTVHNDHGVNAAFLLTHNSNNTNGIVSSDQRPSGNCTHLYMMLRGSLAGYISSSTTTTSYNTSSDYRRKENVVDLTGAIDRVKALPVRRFNWIDEPDETVDGFIAHEAQEIVPEAVTGEKDAVDENGNPVYQVIDQSKFVPLLTAALKEAIEKIEQLEADVATLKGN
jgi:hypothetical protein